LHQKAVGTDFRGSRRERLCSVQGRHGLDSLLVSVAGLKHGPAAVVHIPGFKLNQRSSQLLLCNPCPSWEAAWVALASAALCSAAELADLLAAADKLA
jgi:hypothetical protein